MTKLNRLHDRCDTCQAQAFVRVAKGPCDLLFCAHHFTKSELALLAQGFQVTEDERESVNPKPSLSAVAE
jgi:hypothetical protein